MDFRSIQVESGSPLRNCGLYESHATGVEFDLDEAHLSVAWSEFDRCTFRQRRRTSYEGVWPQGSLAVRPSTYRRCVFRGVRFRILGGFSVGQARFEDCSFQACRFNGLFSHCADFVRCTFEGTLSGAVFFGVAPTGQPCAGKVNDFVDNDFRNVRITNVGWRSGIEVAQQQWPTGYVPDTSA
jgi:hypothetical protein